MVKKKNKLYATLICAVLVCVLWFVIGMRAGQHDNLVIAEERAAETVQMYQEQIAALEHELEIERQTEHVLVTYEYKPLPVDYENIGNVMPEETDAVLLAKTLWGEYNNAANYAQCAAVCWNALNRVDAGYGDLRSVITAEGQYHGYNANNPVDKDLYDIALDVLARWELEKFAVTDVGRVLPRGFLWFEGRNGVNIFRNAYMGGEHITP